MIATVAISFSVGEPLRDFVHLGDRGELLLNQLLLAFLGGRHRAGRLTPSFVRSAICPPGSRQDRLFRHRAAWFPFFTPNFLNERKIDLAWSSLT
jgi:hypothetical protein